MTDIVVAQPNNINIKIACDASIAQELSEFFTFESPGAQFSPAYKKRHWDGKIRLFNLRTYTMYAGLVKYVEEFAQINNYSFRFLNKEETYPVDISNFSKAINLTMEPRDYQAFASSYGLTNKRTVLLSPTASGKSLIIYLMVRYLLQNKKQGLLIVPTVSLVEQMYKDFQEYGWDSEQYCQKIYAGHEKAPTYPLVISTWQSIYDMPKRYFAQFDFVIGDEAHTFKAKSLTDIMTKLINCDVRIGTTGTIDNSKVNKLVLEGLFGPVKKIISTKELIDRQQLADFEIKCLILKYEEAICKTVKGSTYQEEMEFLCGYEPRNNFIRNLSVSLKGNTLILFTYVEKHGKILFESIKKKAGNRKVFFVYGGTDVLDRESIRALTELEEDAIIVASYGTFSTGINIKRLHNIIFASPTKSKIRSLQSIGRGLRLGENKDKAVLYDIADDLRYKTYTNFTLKHYEERFKIYHEEKFQIKTTNVGIS